MANVRGSRVEGSTRRSFSTAGAGDMGRRMVRGKARLGTALLFDCNCLSL